jgi:2-polyprenyl-3-methyl-5-hydroxy-6-metoxy-1,4-benzoquinol methylase
VRSSYAEAGTYRIDACEECGAGATMPRPTADELNRCYQASYGYSTHDLIEVEKRRRAATLLAWAGIDRREPSARGGDPDGSAGGAGARSPRGIERAHILDVGCMFGFLLDEARRQGLAATGIELSEAPAAVAAQKGHDVFTGTIEEFRKARPEAKFSAIFAQHVLEHIAEPHGFLTAAREMLEPGGKLVVCVPNFEARLRKVVPRSWGWYQVPVHLHHFSSRALRRLLADAGFSIDTARTRGGDTLFLALCAMQALGVSTASSSGAGQSSLTRTALRMIGDVTRPYYSLGDDELAVIARA